MADKKKKKIIVKRKYVGNLDMQKIFSEVLTKALENLTKST